METVTVTPAVKTATEQFLSSVKNADKKIMAAIRAKRAGIIAICVTIAAYVASVAAAVSFTGEWLIGLIVLSVFFFLCGPVYGATKNIFTRCLSLGMWPTVLLVFGLAAVSFFSMSNGDFLWRVSVTLMAILGSFAFLGNMAKQDEKESVLLEITKKESEAIEKEQVTLEVASAK